MLLSEEVEISAFILTQGLVLFNSQLKNSNDLPQETEETVTVSLTVNGETRQLLTWQTGKVKNKKLGSTVHAQHPKESTDKARILTLTTALGKSNSYKLLFTGRVVVKQASLVMNM